MVENYQLSLEVQPISKLMGHNIFHSRGRFSGLGFVHNGKRSPPSCKIHMNIQKGFLFVIIVLTLVLWLNEKNNNKSIYEFFQVINISKNIIMF